MHRGVRKSGPVHWALHGMCTIDGYSSVHDTSRYIHLSDAPRAKPHEACYKVRELTSFMSHYRAELLFDAVLIHG